MIRKITVTTFIAILLFAGCGKKDEMNKQETKPTREASTQEQTAPNELQLETIENGVIKLRAIKEGIIFDNFKGKVILLDFFATWCPPCKAAMPHLISIQNSYKEQVQIIGILMEEHKSNEEVKDFKSHYKVNFPITNSAANFELSSALGGIKSLPTMVMYDKNGEYFTHYVGAAPQEMIEADIKKALVK